MIIIIRWKIRYYKMELEISLRDSTSKFDKLPFGDFITDYIRGHKDHLFHVFLVPLKFWIFFPIFSFILVNIHILSLIWELTWGCLILFSFLWLAVLSHYLKARANVWFFLKQMWSIFFNFGYFDSTICLLVISLFWSER